MGWFTSSSSHSKPHSSSSRPSYARSHAGSSYSSTGASRHHASTSHYKRRPRDGYIAYLYHKLRHLLRELWAYARKHPFKVFFMVIMPLVSGGVLHKLAAKFGVTLPDMGQGHAGGMRRDSGGGGGGYYGSEGYEGPGGAGGGLQSLVGGMGGLAGMAKMAQAFM